jgi:glycosyltransferase involved in cell wall biosynthesis
VAQTFAPLVRNKSKLHVIYNLGGIRERQPRCKDRDRYQIRSELGLPTESIVIGQVGRLTRRKRVLDVVRCLPYLSESQRKLFCVFVGSYSGSFETQAVYDEARNLVKQLGTADRVIFTGERQDALSFINGMDVMVLASEAEPMARVIMEALGLCTPVVVSDHAGNAEIIENQVNGLTYALGNSEALAQAVQKVLGDTGLRRRMVENGYRTYDQCFSVEATVATEQALLHKIALGLSTP